MSCVLNTSGGRRRPRGREEAVQRQRSCRKTSLVASEQPCAKMTVASAGRQEGEQGMEGWQSPTMETQQKEKRKEAKAQEES